MGYLDSMVELNNELVRFEPNSINTTSIIQICKEYILKDQKEKANSIINEILTYQPDNIDLLAYKKAISEPDPANVSQQRYREIKEEVVMGISDPARRAFNLGFLAMRRGENQKAIEEFNNVFKGYLDKETEVSSDGTKTEMNPLEKLSVEYLFSLANDSNDWELAEKMVDLARKNNIDGCDGQYYAARLDYDKGEYSDAMVNIESCLKQKPVFSLGYMIMSHISDALGNEDAAIDSARKAVRWSPNNSQLAKSLAIKLYRRNKQLGSNVSNDQILEVRQALDRAIKLNRNDFQLLSFYAEYISDSEPHNALAIRQSLQKLSPSIQNALLLGGLATRMAVDEKDESRKEVLFGIAEAAFGEARKIDPQDKSMLYSYAEYYRARGQEDKAKKLLEQSPDQKILAGHYASMGQFKKARDILEELYMQDSKDISVVQNLIIIAQRMVDFEQAKKYSEELLSLDDNIENRLLQIQVYLNIGLVDEAERKLATFNDKYSDDPRSHVLSSFLMLRKGKFEEALKQVNLSLEIDQGSALAWRLRGEINHGMGQYGQAISDYKQSRLFKDDPVVRIGLAKSYLRAGREEECITELKNAIDDPQVSIQAIEILEGIYYRLNRKEALKSLYDEAIEKYPDNVAMVYRAGDFYGSIGNIAKAEELIKQALDNTQDKDPLYMIVLDAYFQALVLQKKYDILFAEGSKYIDSDFAAFVFVRMAHAKAELGDRITSIDYCKKALERLETVEGSIKSLLKTMVYFMGHQNAAELFNEFLESNPDSRGGNLAMFWMMQTKGDYNKAIKYIDKCIEISGSNADKITQYAVMKSEVLTQAYQRTSDKKYLQEAIKVYESLLSKMPKNVSIMNNLAYMLAANDERIDEALDYARKVCDIYPNNASFNDTLAFVLYKAGKYSEADEMIQSVIQQYESQKTSVPTDTYIHLGMIKEALDKKVQALDAYEQALESVDPQSPDFKSKSETINSLLERVR